MKEKDQPESTENPEQTVSENTVVPKKKGSLIIIAIALVLTAVAAYFAYDYFGNRVVKEIRFAETVIELEVGQEYQLRPIVIPDTAQNYQLTYSSNNKDLVAVTESGMLKATDFIFYDADSTIINVTSDNGVSATVRVLVKNSYAVDFSDKTVNFHGNRVYSLVFKNQVERCTGFSYFFTITEVTKGKNSYFENKKWVVYGRAEKGKWIRLGEFVYEKVGLPKTTTLEFPEVSLSEVICVLESSGNRSSSASWTGYSYISKVEYLK